jgi:hypothetical protein
VERDEREKEEGKRTREIRRWGKGREGEGGGEKDEREKEERKRTRG